MDPPPVRILAKSAVLNSRNLPYCVRFWDTSPPPPRCVRTLWMPPYDKDESPLQQQYHECPQKRESIAAYNEKHRPDKQGHYEELP